MSGSRRIGLPKVLDAFRRIWWLLVATTLAAIVAAIVVSHSQTDRYQATAVMLFGTPSFANSPVTSSTISANPSTPQDQATDLALASLDPVAAQVKRQVGGPVTVDELKNAVSVQLRGNTSLVNVTASWTTPREAAAIANAFADAIVASRRQTAQAQIQQSIDLLETTISAQKSGRSPTRAVNLAALERQVSQFEILKALQTGEVQIIERATPPPGPTSAHLARDVIVGAILGLIVGVLVVLLVVVFDDRIRDEQGLTALISAPVLGRIPKIPRSKRFAHTSCVQEDDAFVDAFESVRLNLQLTHLAQRHLLVAVTSPARADGKTTVVASLARSLAWSGDDVVAADFDMRNPMLHVCFGVRQSNGGGALSALLDADNPNEFAQTTKDPHLRVLTSIKQPPPPGVIAHERLQLMLGRLRETADYVLVDTSPLSVGADATAVVAAADGVILVVDLEQLGPKELLAAKSQLDITRTAILGIVINRAGVNGPAELPHQHDVATPGETSGPTFAA